MRFIEKRKSFILAEPDCLMVKGKKHSRISHTGLVQLVALPHRLACFYFLRVKCIPRRFSRSTGSPSTGAGRQLRVPKWRRSRRSHRNIASLFARRGSSCQTPTPREKLQTPEPLPHKDVTHSPKCNLGRPWHRKKCKDEKFPPKKFVQSAISLSCSSI